MTVADALPPLAMPEIDFGNDPSEDMAERVRYEGAAAGLSPLRLGLKAQMLRDRDSRRSAIREQMRRRARPACSPAALWSAASLCLKAARYSRADAMLPDISLRLANLSNMYKCNRRNHTQSDWNIWRR